MNQHVWSWRFVAVFVIGWTLRIPAAGGVNSWTTSGPPGDAQSVIADSRAVGVVYAGTSNGLFRTNDNGATWVAAGFRGQSATPLATGAPGTVYATLGYGSFTRAALYRSVDSGETWTSVPLESNTYFDLSVDPFTPTTLYRVNHTNVSEFAPPISTFFRSTDSGSTWTEVALPSSASFVGKPATDPFFGGAVYLAAYQPPTFPGSPGFHRIFKSVDAGSSWIVLAESNAGLLLAADPGTPGTIYSGGESSVLARSVDGGRTFAAVANGVFSALAINPSRPRKMYAVRDGNLSQSADGGATWASMGIDWLHPLALALDSTGTFLHAAGGLSGVYDDQFVGDPNVLPLDPGRSFSVALMATDQRTGRSGAGLPIPVSSIFGYFSIPAITGNSGNPEVFVKMLDGTPLNGEYWFFYGGLTDLAYTLTVTDQVNGAVRTYSKTAGSECGGSDTAAFAP